MAARFLFAPLLCLALCGAVCGGAGNEKGRLGPWIRGARSRSGHDVAANSLLALRLVLRGGAGEGGDAGGEKGGEEASAAAPDAMNDEGYEAAAEGRGEQEDEASEDEQEMTRSPNIELLKHLGSKADPRNRKAQTEEMCVLPDLIGKRVVVLMTDGRNMAGMLRSYDRQQNILLTNSTERVFPKFEIREGDLDLKLAYPPETEEEEELLLKLCNYTEECSDEVFLPQPGRLLIKGDHVAGVLEVEEEVVGWEKDPFPRIFAYACARTVEIKKRIKITGDTSEITKLEVPTVPSEQQPS